MQTIYVSLCSSPLGKIRLAECGGFLCGVSLETQSFPWLLSGGVAQERETPVLLQAKAWLARYFAGEKPAPGELMLAPDGGEFRQTVWRILCEIPYGETVTYGELAKEVARRLGKEKMSAQAIGGAVGHNPISVIIPCHRVVGAGGNLTGYGGGLEMKIKLLRHEGVDMSCFYVPKKGTAL